MDGVESIAKDFQVHRVASVASVKGKGMVVRPEPQDAVVVSKDAVEAAKIEGFVERLKQMPDDLKEIPDPNQDPLQVVAERLVSELVI